MTIRLSMSSLAGTERTLVAVGTARLDVMLVTVLAAAPRSLVTSASVGVLRQPSGCSPPWLPWARAEPLVGGLTVDGAAAGAAAEGAASSRVPGACLASA